MSKKKKTSNKEIILSIIMVLWFFGSIGYMLYASNTQHGTQKVLITFGQIFAIVGLFAVISCLKAGQVLSGLISSIFLIVGVGTILGGVCGLTNNQTLQSILSAIMPYLFVIVFFAISIGLISVPMYQCYLTKVKYIDKVQVECVHVNSHISHSDNRNQMMYSPVWRGWYHGKYVTFTCNNFTSRKYKVGQSETISVNPNDETKYMDSSKQFGYKISFGIGIGFFIASCMLMYSVIHQ